LSVFIGYFYCTENLNWAAQNLQLGHGLDMAGLEAVFFSSHFLVIDCYCKTFKNVFEMTEELTHPRHNS